MKHRILSLTALTLILLLQGCAATQPQQVRTLPQTDQLQTSFWSDGALVYVKPGTTNASLNRYQKAILEPVSYLPGSEALTDIQPQDLQYIRRQLDQALQQALTVDIPLVQRPSDDTLGIRLTITSLTRTAPPNSVLDYIPFRLIINGAKSIIHEAQKKEEIVYNITIELEGYDSVSGETLFAMADTRSSDSILVSKGESAIAAADQPLQYWAERFAKNWKRSREDQI